MEYPWKDKLEAGNGGCLLRGHQIAGGLGWEGDLVFTFGACNFVVIVCSVFSMP